MLTPANPSPRNLSHHPATAATLVERRIHTAVIERIVILPTTSRTKVAWAKDRSDKKDQRERILAVFADEVEVPPGVAPVREGEVKAKRLITWSAH